MKLLLLLPLLLASCSAPNYVRFADGTTLAIGATLGEDTAAERYEFQDGPRRLVVEKQGKNQSDTVQAVTTGIVAWKGLDVMGEANHDAEATNQIGIKEGASTQRHAATVNAQTEQLRIKH